MKRGVPKQNHRHVLTPNEIVTRMIDFDQHANTLTWKEVADYWVEKAEAEYEKARSGGAGEHKITRLRTELDERYRVRADAILMYNELSRRPGDFAPGQRPDILEYTERAIKHDLAEYTKASVYHWARARGKEVPEWAQRDHFVKEVNEKSSQSVKALENLNTTLSQTTKHMGFSRSSSSQHPTFDNDRGFVTRSRIENQPDAKFAVIPETDVTSSESLDLHRAQGVNKNTLETLFFVARAITMLSESDDEAGDGENLDIPQLVEDILAVGEQLRNTNTPESELEGRPNYVSAVINSALFCCHADPRHAASIWDR